MSAAVTNICKRVADYLATEFPEIGELDRLSSSFSSQFICFKHSNEQAKSVLTKFFIRNEWLPLGFIKEIRFVNESRIYIFLDIPGHPDFIKYLNSSIDRW